jgi:hypothetical protein
MTSFTRSPQCIRGFCIAKQPSVSSIHTASQCSRLVRRTLISNSLPVSRWCLGMIAHTYSYRRCWLQRQRQSIHSEQRTAVLRVAHTVGQAICILCLFMSARHACHHYKLTEIGPSNWTEECSGNIINTETFNRI